MGDPLYHTLEAVPLPNDNGRVCLPAVRKRNVLHRASGSSHKLNNRDIVFGDRTQTAKSQSMPWPMMVLSYTVIEYALVAMFSL
jgi:hypothetical protein